MSGMGTYCRLPDIHDCRRLAPLSPFQVECMDKKASFPKVPRHQVAGDIRLIDVHHRCCGLHSLGNNVRTFPDRRGSRQVGLCIHRALYRPYRQAHQVFQEITIYRRNRQEHEGIQSPNFSFNILSSESNEPSTDRIVPSRSINKVLPAALGIPCLYHIPSLSFTST